MTNRNRAPNSGSPDTDKQILNPRAPLEDDMHARIVALAERKLAEGRDVVELVEGESDEEAEVIDLMDVLKRSLSTG